MSASIIYGIICGIIYGMNYCRKCVNNWVRMGGQLRIGCPLIIPCAFGRLAAYDYWSAGCPTS